MRITTGSEACHSALFELTDREATVHRDARINKTSAAFKTESQEQADACVAFAVFKFPVAERKGR